MNKRKYTVLKPGDIVQACKVNKDDYKPDYPDSPSGISELHNMPHITQCTSIQRAGKEIWINTPEWTFVKRSLKKPVQFGTEQIKIYFQINEPKFSNL